MVASRFDSPVSWPAHCEPGLCTPRIQTGSTTWHLSLDARQLRGPCRRLLSPISYARSDGLGQDYVRSPPAGDVLIQHWLSLPFTSLLPDRPLCRCSQACGCERCPKESRSDWASLPLSKCRGQLTSVWRHDLFRLRRDSPSREGAPVRKDPVLARWTDPAMRPSECRPRRS